MSENASGAGASPVTPFQRLTVTYAVFAGVALGVVGVIVGIVVAVHSTVVECPDGTEFAIGEPDVCYSYPHAGIGAVLAIIALIATIAVGLLGVLVFRALGPPPRRTFAMPVVEASKPADGTGS